MLNREIRSQVDTLRDAMWSGGVSNPLTGVEQRTYLLFIRRGEDAGASTMILANPPFTDATPNGVSDVFDLHKTQAIVTAIRDLAPRYASYA